MDATIQHLTQSEMDSSHGSLDRDIDLGLVDPKMISYMKELEKSRWLCTISCCEGNRPSGEAYVLFRILEEMIPVGEDIFMKIVDLYHEHEVYFIKTMDYRDGKIYLYYQFLMPSTKLDEIMPVLVKEVLQQT